MGAEDSVLSTLRGLQLDPAQLKGSSVLVEANRAEMSQMRSAASARQLGSLGCGLVPSPRVLSQQDTPATLCEYVHTYAEVYLSLKTSVKEVTYYELYTAQFYLYDIVEDSAQWTGHWGFQG